MTVTSLISRPRTILGSLTTTFTPPESCAYLADPDVTLFRTRTGDHGHPVWRGQSCNPTIWDGFMDATDCWPPTTAGAAAPSNPFAGWGFYSPGLVCPAGHTSACSATASGYANWEVQYELTAGETAVGCCPLGYSCTNFVTALAGQSCVLIATSTVVTTATCDPSNAYSFVAGLGTWPTVQTHTSAVAVASDTALTTTTTATVPVDALYALAPMIQINWQGSDRSSTTSTAWGPGAWSGVPWSGLPWTVPTTTSTPAATTTPTSSATSAANSETHGRVGTIAGAAVGGVLGLCAILVAGFYVWKRSRRRQKQDTSDLQERSGQQRGSADKQEVPAVPVVEAPGRPNSHFYPSELSDSFRAPELPSGEERTYIHEAP